MSTAPKTHLTAQEYLVIERNSEIRSEYFRGEMFAMTGASREHNVICMNVGRRLLEQFDGRSCEAYQSDMRVRVSETGLYTYPDVVAICGEPQFDDDHLDTLTDPQVIFEVFSDSTEGYVRGKKFQEYRELGSLRDYILISQKECVVERYTRQPDNQWLFWSTNKIADTLKIASIDCKLKLEDVYARIEFSEEEEKQA